MKRLVRFFETLIDPFREHDVSMPPPTLAGFYWYYTRQVWPALAALMVVGFVVSLIEVSLFRYVGSIVDLLRATSPDKVLADYGWTFAWMGFVVVIARPVATIMHDLLVQQSLAPSFTNLVRWQTHRYVLRQTVGFFTNDYAGRIASKIIQTGPALRESVVQVCDALWFVTMYSVSALILFGQLDWRLTLPLVAWIILFVAALIVMVPRIRERSTIVSEARSMLTGRIVDSYTNIQTVKLFAHTAREDEYAADAVADHTTKFRASTRLITLMSAMVVSMNGLLIAGTMALCVWLWSMDILSLGAITLASGLAIRIATMSGWIMWTSIGIFDNVGAVQEGLSTIAQPQALVDRPDARPIHVDKGGIVFDHVSFHYGRKGGIIEDLSLSIRPGEKVGVVGRSGAGKSTLINLLLRFYDLESGRILIDGQDIANATQDSLRSQIGLVTQDTSLLHRSIRDNILYGRPEAPEAAVEDAARQAHAAEFIPALSDHWNRTGFDAHVGERGAKLSGGQRQRIAIARVLLKDAPILVLDEATSALDSEVEGAIQESLYRLMRDKTVIAIAHRLSTIAAMDRLVVLDKGRVIETGTHGELLARGGLYASLWARQSGGFLDVGDEARGPAVAAAE
ncbi:MAG: ABC transporter ATP-binding protein [Rhizobiales bacterium]|nr:ABC transporter ATP-binding protein [Hyphomicrobiales bacterium]